MVKTIAFISFWTTKTTHHETNYNSTLNKVHRLAVKTDTQFTTFDTS